MNKKTILLSGFLLFTVIFIRCTSGEPNLSPDLLKLKANSFYNANQYDSSTLYFTYLLHMDSLNGEYYFKRGYSNARIFNQPQAINDFLKAAELKYKPAESFYNIAVNYELRNDSLALIYYKKSFEIDSTDPEIKDDIRDVLERLKMQKARKINFFPDESHPAEEAKILVSEN